MLTIPTCQGYSCSEIEVEPPVSRNPNHPRADDVVLGDQTPTPVHAGVLGGLLGVKQRLTSPAIEQRIAALAEALKYGEDGLELVVQALKDESGKVRRAALSLLQIQTDSRVKEFSQNYTTSGNRFDTFVAMGRSGRPSDVDRLLQALEDERDTASSKLIDYALGLVGTTQGKARIKHYLFNGTQMQRNYAALYFKRQNDRAVLEEAVKQGCIDRVQAFSK